ncbi:hypothetical protein ALC56_09917 [Trachymyrmex septentrionalis]|uniref:Mos1 transposase HTH domain-containing protein n=1 Tax=Trachymyrmex septentrionalis TaxID=34720 RepID=A0A195F6B8_9HYME|nr:hypothetical protein ALC56_09917 [Trachymyrmex septentrionalis]
MEISRENFRAMIFYDYKCNLTPKQCIDRLHLAFGDKVPSSSNNVELMTHCPYSPDLSPNDFFLFPNIKNKMRGERFESPEAAIETFRTLIPEVTALEWKKCFENAGGAAVLVRSNINYYEEL